MYRSPKLTLELLLEAIDRLESLFAVYDNDNKLLYVNQSALDAWPDFYGGIAAGESHFDAMKKEIRTQFPQLPDKQIDQFTNFSLNIVRPGGKGELHTRDLRVFQTHHEKLGDVGTVGIGVDLTELKAHQKELKKMVRKNRELANNDELTGLSNRRHFVSDIDALIENAADEADTFTLGLFDLDGFKSVNDVYGHPVGDALLKEVATRLTETMGEASLLARLGGDEFGFVCLDHLDDEQIRERVDALAEVLSQPYSVNGYKLRVSASIGIATFPQAAETRELLFKRADFAMYHAKQNAKGHAVLFSEEHEERIERQARLNLNFREADLEDELYLEYQPIYDFATRQVSAVEALARWWNPELGLVRPDQFITIAETSGQITKVSRILFRKALRAAATWPDSVRLSFNLSPLEVTSRDHAEAMIAEIKRSGVMPKRVVFELTENAMIEDTETVSEILQLFRDHGIRIALDDFGAGFSSLNHLSQMPIDIVKIDRAFVGGLGARKKTRAMLNGIVRLCRDMSLLTVLEGVETDLQMFNLQNSDVDFVQGYLFSRPQNEESIFEYLRAAEEAHPEQVANSQ